ncbi:MAG TPA: hypothetical protein PKA61_12325 [Nitrospira sp.]|nr:hypothetical protein [Nitrospira sp.]
MASQTVGLDEARQEIQSVEVNILDVLRQRGAKTLDQLEGELVHIGSAQLLFAIDRLSRSGRIAIGPPIKGGYLVWAMPEPAAWPGRVESVSGAGF